MVSPQVARIFTNGSSMEPLEPGGSATGISLGPPNILISTGVLIDNIGMQWPALLILSKTYQCFVVIILAKICAIHLIL